MTAVADRPVRPVRPVRTMLSIQLRWIAVLVVGSALYAAVLAALLGTGDMAATWWLHRDRRGAVYVSG